MKYLLSVLLAIGVCSTALADKANWGSDFEAAKAQAVKDDKPILAFFTGSDWCGWCIKLDSEVLSKSEFVKFANEKFVLFVADFPRGKKQSDKIKEANKKLAEQYGVRGFPTILLLDKEGEVIAQTGYQPGGPAKYVKHLKELLAKKAE